MDVLAREIQSGDGVANAAIAEAADRLRELERKLNEVNLLLDLARNDRDINHEKLVNVKLGYTHRRGNGAVALAIEMLKSIKDVGNENGIANKTRPMEGQRIKCFGRNELPIGEGIYHNARIVKNHSRAFVSLDDGFWASWNSVKRWTTA